MGIYVSSYCPHCRHRLEGPQRTGFDDYTQDIGNPVELCPKCNRPFVTRKKYWSIMSSWERRKVYFRVYSGAVVIGIVAGMLCSVGTSWLLERAWEINMSPERQCYLVLGAMFVMVLPCLGFAKKIMRDIKLWKPDGDHIILATSAMCNGVFF